MTILKVATADLCSTVIYLTTQLIIAPVLFGLAILEWLRTALGLHKHRKSPKCILITGATSGLGEQLALDYAQKGVLLAISGRNRTRLQNVVLACEALGSRVMSKVVDVTDAEAMQKWVEDVDQELPIDLLIANAGVTETTAGTRTVEAATKSLFDINVQGVFNTVIPAIPLFRRHGGQIAIVGSLASFVQPLGGSGVYSASKAALRAWGEGLRADLAPYDVAVNVICPGYVDTPMTEVQRHAKPFKISANQSSQIIRDGLQADLPLIGFPIPLFALVQACQAVPPSVRHFAAWMGFGKIMGLAYRRRPSKHDKEI